MGSLHRAARKWGDSSESPVCLLGTHCSQLSEKWHFAALLIRSLLSCAAATQQSELRERAALLAPAPPNSRARSGVVRIQNLFLLKNERAFKSRFYVLFSTLPFRSAVLHVPHILCGCIWDPTVAVPPIISSSQAGSRQPQMRSPS